MAKPNWDSVRSSIRYIEERIEAVNKDREIAQLKHDNYHMQNDSLDYLISAVETLTEVVRAQTRLIDYLADYIE